MSTCVLLRGNTLTRAHRDGTDCGFAACRACTRHRMASTQPRA